MFCNAQEQQERFTSARSRAEQLGSYFIQALAMWLASDQASSAGVAQQASLAAAAAAYAHQQAGVGVAAARHNLDVLLQYMPVGLSDGTRSQADGAVHRGEEQQRQCGEWLQLVQQAAGVAQAMQDFSAAEQRARQQHAHVRSWQAVLGNSFDTVLLGKVREHISYREDAVERALEHPAAAVDGVRLPSAAASTYSDTLLHMCNGLKTNSLKLQW